MNLRIYRSWFRDIAAFCLEVSAPKKCYLVHSCLIRFVWAIRLSVLMKKEAINSLKLWKIEQTSS